jgi:hypothetical protein
VLRDAIAKSTTDKSAQCLKPCDGCGEPARTASLCVESSGERDLQFDCLACSVNCSSTQAYCFCSMRLAERSR